MNYSKAGSLLNFYWVAMTENKQTMSQQQQQQNFITFDISLII